MKLYEKLHTIQTKIKGLSKNGKSHNYEYVNGNKLLSFIKPLMDEHKLLLKQEILSIDNERMDYKTKYAEKSEILSKVMMRFTWIDVETGDTDINLFGANGQNDWEKGLGSALTYAERYFLLKYFHIPTDKDDIDYKERVSTSEASPIEEKQTQKTVSRVFTLDVAKEEAKNNTALEELKKRFDLVDSQEVKYNKLLKTYHDSINECDATESDIH